MTKENFSVFKSEIIQTLNGPATAGWKKYVWGWDACQLQNNQ